MRRAARRGPRRRSGQAGFTLLELLVTMAVTVIGLLGLMAMHVATVKGNEATARASAAVSVAQDTLEELRSTSMTGLVTRFAVTDLPIDANLNTVVGRDGTTYSRRVRIDELTGVSRDLVKLRVEVTWTEDGQAANGDADDHKVGLEVVRTTLEGL
jgi:prepilin-type N-terminal cleavage/methylation domain-containing protein